ncbi:MAG: methyltransferase domain-containing protein [Sulfitobacter sp.]|nr:methyltransferase domain-containing protein [Sulfitobacter sp.]
MGSDTTDPMEAFFRLHRDLPREGPGEAADVAWACARVGIGPKAQMADVGCGPGADIAALLGAAPEGQVTALDKTAHFVKAARQRFASDGRVTVLQADMAAIRNQYDLIWCAGAVYFLGVEQALRTWRKALRPGGAIAFSEPCWLTEAPSPRARSYWAAEGYDLQDPEGIAAAIDAAGYDLLETRLLSDAAWETYFAPLDERIAALRPEVDETLTAVLDQAEEEAACWRAHRDEYGYLLHLVRPK